MKYVVERNNDEVSLVSYKVNMNGLVVHPKNNSKSVTIKANKIMFVDSYLSESYIRQIINKRINRVINFMLHILGEEDTSEGDSAMVLDEVNRLKGIIIKKYKEYMSNEEYKETLNKLLIIEDEFKKNYNRKMFSNYMNNIYYEDGYYSSRGR